jgi:hypothetical protein
LWDHHWSESVAKYAVWLSGLLDSCVLAFWASV